jgi:hypothetical protein
VEAVAEADRVAQRDCARRDLIGVDTEPIARRVTV